MTLSRIALCLVAVTALSLSSWSQAAETLPAAPAPKKAAQPADPLALKQKRLVELEARLKVDKEMPTETRTNLEKLVARLRAELAPAPEALQQQTKRD